jgi:YEATS family
LLSDVFSPLSESIKDILISPPDTNVIKAMVFNNSNSNLSKIDNNGVNPGRALTAYLKSDKYASFECSLDGEPFQDCISPKTYTNLQTEVGHIFQVRAKGILGNVDKTPYIFNFTTITSATVKGIAKYNDSSNLVVDDSPIRIDNNLYKETDIKGRFLFRGITEGRHTIHIYSKPDNNYRNDVFDILPGEKLKDMQTIFIDDFSPDITEIGSEKQNPSSINQINPELKRIQAAASLSSKENISALSANTENVTLGQNIKLGQETDYKNETRIGHSKIWINASDNVLAKIESVKYFLHPTFVPNNVTISTPENRFAITFTHWGKFDLGARVYFNDGSITNLVLDKEHWQVTSFS